MFRLRYVRPTCPQFVRSCCQEAIPIHLREFSSNATQKHLTITVVQRWSRHGFRLGKPKQHNRNHQSCFGCILLGLGLHSTQRLLQWWSLIHKLYLTVQFDLVSRVLNYLLIQKYEFSQKIKIFFRVLQNVKRSNRGRSN